MINLIAGLPAQIVGAFTGTYGFPVLLIASGLAVAALISGVGLIRRSRRNARRDAERYFR